MVHLARAFPCATPHPNSSLYVVYYALPLNLYDRHLAGNKEDLVICILLPFLS
jgi:hypothetical protein